MNDRDALLAAILNDPADDLARLVLADLLRETDDLDDRARGRFLWAGVTASQYRTNELIEDRLYYTAQDEFTEIASAGYPARWLAALGLGPIEPTGPQWGWDSKHDRVTVRLGEITAVYLRGLLTELTVPSAVWPAVAGGVFAACPLEQVAYPDVRGLTFAIEKAMGGWRMTGRLRVPRRRVPLGTGVIPQAFAQTAFLTEERAEWKAVHTAPDRLRLVDSIGPVFVRMTAELRDIAGDRWPGR